MRCFAAYASQLLLLHPEGDDLGTRAFNVKARSLTCLELLLCQTLKALGDLKSLFCQIFQLCRLPLLQCSGHCLKGDLPTCREPVLFDSNCVHPCAISGMREAAR
ncbi:MAG: hypothetical protein BWZ07_03370 [Alphaproteobacteria bacterium ADurb.BinA280]|jgi:hypothetical protein|nr:hypothetical protein HMPREF1308_04945 [Klebsiella pneumoniae subsp. pneumoniae WGLW5]ERP00233.1 hypothetical protein L360_04685 [Enterobacter sp. MGH 14]ERW78829.1 hypothetical protein Q019_04142 [Pseudomonas aeruginosa BWHPSA006]ESM86856.1 hypothetical protein L380_01078 [Enterobacter roggenkampii MGH 34]EUM74111.1 hypothetical protein L353_08706 [Enterobacter sp. MGH 7]KQJ67144.1 hypothetical protein AN400_01930 [Pseudomonas aeruginosa]OPZ07203.1 MAG: hypothetical protein BWZ07_03370 [Al